MEFSGRIIVGNVFLCTRFRYYFYSYNFLNSENFNGTTARGIQDIVTQITCFGVIDISYCCI